MMEQRKRVLLVDDVRLFLEMEKSFFTRDQVEITVAHNGQEALRSLSALKPHLVIMDLNMPVMDGAEACRRIKEDPAFFTLPVILTTADERQEELDRCWSAGCDAIVTKPLNRQQLLQVARRFLELAERAAPRVTTRMLVHYGVAEQQTLHDFSVNIAAGGLFLETAQPLPIGTPLTLEFFIPGAAETVRCKGRVAWINTAASPTKPELPSGFGVQFSEMAPRDVRAIREFILLEIRGPA